MTIPDFRFADRYQTRQILTDASAARQFEGEFLRAEADYFEQARDPRTGLVYDGLDLDPRTGTVEKPRAWSAPSKECLDLGILIKALEGDAKAVQVVGRGDAARARQQATQLLAKKLDAYEEFHAKNPQYAGYMPWFLIGQEALSTDGYWKDKIPGLDNGEWMWTMLVAEKALRDSGNAELAERYGSYNQLLKDNVTKVFFDPDGVACRGDVRIKVGEGGKVSYGPLNPGSYMTGEHGVHEGCMLIHYLTLFGKDLPAGAADKIWNDIQMVRVETPHGTTWQGFWGSSHESWAYLFLPFRDHQGYDDLFRIREVIRSQNAVDRGYPAFATSINGPKGEYLAAGGIEGIGTQPITANHAFAVYGTFPMLLQFAQHAGPGNFALAWLHNSLTAPRMQGPLGAGESCLNDGSDFAPMKTTDGTHPMLLAMMGGLEKECAEVMQEQGVYQQFMRRIDSEYRESFADRPLREPVGFAAPAHKVPRQPLGDYLIAPR